MILPPPHVFLRRARNETGHKLGMVSDMRLVMGLEMGLGMWDVGWALYRTWNWAREFNEIK